MAPALPTIGVIPPPPGVVPNFVNPPSEGPVTIGVVISLFFFVTTLVLGRCLVRYRAKRFSWDDFFCITAWLGYLTLSSMWLWSVKYGTGRDFWNVTIEEAQQYTKVSLPIENVIRGTTFFAKEGILFMYTNFFYPRQAIKDNTYRFIIGVASVSGVFWVVQITVMGVLCTRKFEDVHSQCVNDIGVLLPAAIFNVTLDCIIFMIPIWCIWRLHLKLKQKFKVWGVFSVGFLGVSMSVGRLIYQVDNLKNTNSTIVLNRVVLINLGELTAAYVVLTTPVIFSLWKQRSRQAPAQQHIPLRPMNSPAQPQRAHTPLSMGFAEAISNPFDEAISMEYDQACAGEDLEKQSSYSSLQQPDPCAAVERRQRRSILSPIDWKSPAFASREQLGYAGPIGQAF